MISYVYMTFRYCQAVKLFQLRRFICIRSKFRGVNTLHFVKCMVMMNRKHSVVSMSLTFLMLWIAFTYDCLFNFTENRTFLNQRDKKKPMELNNHFICNKMKLKEN